MSHSIKVFLSYVLDASMAEAYAFRERLILAQQIGGSNRFILQTDCAQVVDTMKNRGFSSSSLAAIYDDCYIIWSDFGNVSLEHCNMEVNPVAHKLYKVSYILSNSNVLSDQ